MRNRSIWGAVVVFLLALALRLAHLFQMSANPLFADPTVDAGTYADWATRLAAGHWLGLKEGPFWQPPLYPYFLGLIKVVFPDSFFYVSRLFQVVMGAFSCLLLQQIGQRLFTPAVGFIAAVIAALYGPFIYFDARLLPVGLATFFMLSSLLVLLCSVVHLKKRYLLAAGLLLGLAAITVASMLVLIPVSLVWIYYQFRAELDRQQTLMRCACVLFGTVLIITPVSLRNYAIGGDAVLISYNGGINFYIGNNAEREKTLNVRPGWEWEALVSQPQSEGIMRPSARSQFFYAKAFAYTLHEPLDFTSALIKKALQFWRGDEIERNQEIYYWRKYSVILTALLWKWGVAFPFGLVSPLALMGLLVYIRQRRMLLPVVYILIYALAMAAFFVTARYRLPMVPLLILFAVYGGTWLAGRWRNQSIRRALWPSVALGLLVLLVNWGGKPMDMRGSAATHNDLGNAFLHRGRLDLALLKYQQAVRFDPTYWQAWFNLGSLRAMRGDLRGAQSIFARVLEHHPERTDVWSNLAGTYVGLGDHQRAAQTLEQALLASPPRPDIYVELLRLYVNARQYDKADTLYHRALLEFPQNEQLQFLHAALEH